MEPCGHSLHKDHYQYFAYANMVASFKYVVFYVELILNVLFFYSHGNITNIKCFQKFKYIFQFQV